MINILANLSCHEKNPSTTHIPKNSCSKFFWKMFKNFKVFFIISVSSCFLLTFTKLSGYLKYYDSDIANTRVY